MPEIRRLALGAAVGLVCAGALRAQVPPGATPHERALLARAESLVAQVETRRERQRQEDRERSRARLVESAGLAVVVPGQASPDQVLRSLDTAARFLQGFGGVPDGFARSVVVVLANATDTAAVLASPVVQGRQRVRIGGIQRTETAHGASVLNVPALAMATAIATAYRDTRDADWREWLPGDLGVGPWTRSAAWGAFESLSRGTLAVGARCLDGEVQGCRLWLGVDRDSSRFQARYTANEIREFVGRYAQWETRRSTAAQQCLGGADSACFEYATEKHHPISPFPADEGGRRSLVRAVGALHGSEAIGRALADTAGSVGDRFARASGVSEDSLLREWRYWVLTRGRRPQDRELLADALPSILLAGLLLAAARRSRG